MLAFATRVPRCQGKRIGFYPRHGVRRRKSSDQVGRIGETESLLLLVETVQKGFDKLVDFLGLLHVDHVASSRDAIHEDRLRQTVCV